MTRTRKNSRKSSKKRTSPGALGKLAVALAALGVLYLVFETTRVKDLSRHSIELEHEVNRVLTESGVTLDQILQKYQTEEERDYKRWVRFTKEVQVKDSAAPALAEKLIKIAAPPYKAEHAKKPDREEIRFYYKGIHINEVLLKILRPQNVVAIIVDDLGQKKSIREFMELDVPVTYAIIPGLPYSKFLAHELKNSGIPYILHMPMEPESYPEDDPGDMALFAGMSREKIEELLEAALLSVPGAPGMNNHMGSRFTSDFKSVSALLDILKKKGMFFIDSATAKKRIALEYAKKIGLPAAENEFYIDNKDDYDYVVKRLKKLQAIALKNARTIAICHITRKNTAKALKDYLPEMIRSGVRFVPVAEVLEKPDTD
ncbi:MAG: divergent polysaccharide deacetylase family protein [Elusimicrobia bacterium]|nr:divergent polysaccharide deacetylase family protein [Elusimicrobiota bacterium]